MQTQLNHRIQPFWVQETQLAPSSRTLAGFAIGATRSVHTPLKHLFRETTLGSDQNLCVTIIKLRITRSKVLTK